MANLYKPTYTRTDPETGEKTQHKLSKWYGKYRDANGKLCKAALSEDKTAARAMLSELIRKAHWQAAGLVDPAAEQLERSIAAHVDDYKSHLEAKARSDKHISETVRVIKNVVAEIRCDVLADLQGGKELWPGSWWEKSAKMLRQDLKDAGISPVDEQGRVVDFHGQRTTFITGLARAGVSVSTAQKLARHSDVNLTMGTYTRLEITELADAVGKLPKLVFESGSASARDSRSTDAELQGLVAAWPSLTEKVRSAILQLVNQK